MYVLLALFPGLACI